MSECKIKKLIQKESKEVRYGMNVEVKNRKVKGIRACFSVDVLFESETAVDVMKSKEFSSLYLPISRALLAANCGDEEDFLLDDYISHVSLMGKSVPGSGLPILVRL